MKYLKIRNDGELDLRLVSLMGGTTKKDSPNLIGEWGSGLKYTLAFLLRNNLDFQIFIGDKPVRITTVSEKIKDTVFDIIYIDGERTSITSNMGADWKHWMICREILSNSLDEGGSLVEETEDLIGVEGTTTFFIQIDVGIREVMDNWDKYFLLKEKPLWENYSFKIYNSKEHFRMYKQGILIFEDRKIKSVFDYDIKRANINELREFRGTPDYELSEALKRCDSPEVITLFIDKVRKGHFEAGMTWVSWIKFSETWTKVLEKGKLVSGEVMEKLKASGKVIPKDLIIVPKDVYEALIDTFPYLSAVTVIKGSGAFYEDYNEKAEQKIEEGLVILEACGYYVDAALEFRYGLFENRSVQAQVHIEDKLILISNSLMQKPLSTIVSILIEENEHYLTGMEDETREFQQHFIDLYTRELLQRNSIEI